jgi:ATP-binding cassette subfamily B protein
MSEYNTFEEEEFASQFNGGTLMRIFGLLKPHRVMVMGFVFAIIAEAALGLTLTYLMSRIIDDGIVARDLNALNGFMGQYAIVAAALSFVVFVFIYLTGKLGQQVTYDLRKSMFNHLQNLSFSYYNKTPVGWIMSRVTSDSERIAELVSWGLLDLMWAISSIIIALGFMLTINWQLALIVVPLVPVLIWIALWFKKKILVEFRISRKTNSKITGNYNEMITGVRVIKALNREETSLQEFGTLTREMYRSSYRAAWYSALFLPAVQILSAVFIALVMLFGGIQVEGSIVGGLTIGGLNAFISYITVMLWPVQDMARVYASMQHAIASAERSFSLLDAKPDIVDRPDAYDPGSIVGDIVFEDVDFWYNSEQPVLKKFNLTVKAGETIALVGHTGSGKSTLVNLVCRFYEPVGGRITFNGEDYKDLTLHAIHSRIGMVLQTPHLFSGTIAENIRYGRLDASDEDIIEAAKMAGAHDFISAFENGYDEKVGEGGSMLSVGQKQLLSIARAILSQPELFVMDEATSSVDTLTEELIQQAMENAMQGRTSFVIAHRLSTIKNADRIIVLENGKIIEMGTHAELLAQGGHYYTLYTKQFRREREEHYQLNRYDLPSSDEQETVAEKVAS